MASSIISSVVSGGANNHATVSSEANAYASDWVSQGVVGPTTNTNNLAPSTGSFAVNADSSPDMGLTILGTGSTLSTESVAYVSVTPGSQDKQMLRCRMSADYTGYVINPNTTGSTVYDWIYLQANATNAGTPSSSADNVINLYTSRSTSNSADNGTPPTYGTLLAVVTVVNNATSITNANISDRRTSSVLSVTSGSSAGWSTLGSALTYSANNGNREFVATTSVDMTGVLTPGMRMQITRGVTPPSQCMSFTAASSQYATKSSPTGISFTGVFSCEAWVYLNSYTGHPQAIVNRNDNAGTSGGWGLSVTAKGAPYIFYGTGSSFTTITAYQSIPLKRWVHVAGVVTSIGSKTGAIYIDGASALASNTSNAATALVQASVDLRVGASSATASNSYFDGYLSEVRVWSTNVTQANIQANMGVNLVGSETSLVALFQGNGNFTDATSNANTLTGSGGASATASKNPYNTVEYFLITAVTSSTLTVFGGTDYTLPNMTLSTPQYSLQKVPFGFPASRNKWQVTIPNYNNTGRSAPAASTWYNFGGMSILVPTGAWKLRYATNAYADKASNLADMLTTLSTANNSESDPLSTDYMRIDAAGATTLQQSMRATGQLDLDLSAATNYYLNVQTGQSSMNQLRLSEGAPTTIQAESAYV